MKSGNIETHIMEINGYRFRITNDSWTGDWAVEALDKKYTQPYYVKTKRGAINYCLVEASVMKRSEVDYEKAPDRTSA